MSPRDPTRWSEAGGGAPSNLETLLRAARKDLPDSREMKAMGLTTATIATICASSATTGGGAAGGSLSAGQTGGSVAGAQGAGALGAAAVAKIGGALLVVGAATGVWATLTRGTDPAPEVPVEASGAELSADAHRAPNATASVPPPAQAPEPEPIPQEPERTVAEPARQARLPSTPRADGDSPMTEIGLLRAAQSALRTHPARALELARRHQASFPAGQLSQEREVIRIEALRRLGRSREALSAERNFDRDYPGSAHRSKLDGTPSPAPQPKPRPE